MSTVPAQAPIAPTQRPIKLRPVHEKIGLTVKKFHDCGWNNEQLVEHGYADWVESDAEPVECMLCAGSGHQEDANISDVTRQLIERDLHGREKYGVTLDRTDLSLTDWLQHQAEELMDGAGYALAAKREAERLQAIASLAGKLVARIEVDNELVRMGPASRGVLSELKALMGMVQQ